MNHFVLITPELTNRLRHSTIKKEVGKLISKAGGRFEALKAIVFTHVGHIKAPGIEHLIFSEDDKSQLLNLLQPGDIILTYAEGFMSNIFLPGIFKHGMIYTGRRENWDQSDCDKIHITDHQKSLIQVNDNIIEAIAEGVVSGPLEEILDTGVNRLAVFRPSLSNQEIMGVMQTIHSYLGNQYDFSFDKSQHDDDLCHQNILIDKTSADLLKGSEVDFVKELIGDSFKINNPQSKSSCGCGTSFSI